MSCYGKDYDRQWRERNRDRVRESNKQWCQRNKDARAVISRKHHLKKKFGISLDTYNEMFSQQSGSCAICGKHELDNGGKRLAIDHNHETGQIRSLLCHNCNTGIGHFEDDVSIVEKAVNYLKRWEN